MLRAFFDDSGRGQEPIYVLAGFVARAEAWARFSDKWAEALHQAPRIEYFKMNEANTLTGQFKGWTEDTRDKKMLALVHAIKGHVLCGLSVVMRHKDYAEIFKGHIHERMDQAYFWMYNRVLHLCTLWQANNGLDEKMDFVFDEQQGESDFILSNHDLFMSVAPDVIRNKLSRPTFMNDRDTPALQAADMYVGHMRSEFLHEGINIPTLKIFGEIATLQGRIERNDLEEFRSKLMFEALKTFALFPHQARKAKTRWEELSTKKTIELLESAKPGGLIYILPLRAKRTSKYQLVRTCPRVCSPHLHNKCGDECLAQ
ncbi:MAG: DUF3800 domain-containing protein [Steroidobacteraceae bacterium]